MAYFEICPRCRSNDVSGNHKQAFARCESCGFASAAGEELYEATQSSSLCKNTSTSHVFSFQQLPSVIALPLRDYIEEREPVLKLWHACDVVELTLRLLVMVGRADLRRHRYLPNP